MNNKIGIKRNASCIRKIEYKSIIQYFSTKSNIAYSLAKGIYDYLYII